MIIQLGIIILGFLFLVRGADVLVRGASGLALRLGVSSLLVGLTVVALGTSMPELVVNVLSAVRGSGDLAIGNVLGSNIANIALVLGASAIILPLRVQSTIIWREVPFALLAIFLVAVMAADRALDGGPVDALSRIDGIVLLSMLSVFLYYLIGGARATRSEPELPSPPQGRFSWGRNIWDIVIGIVMLVVGGKFVVDNAVLIASALGVSQKLIGLTIVAIGTSLPELVTSIVAVRKGETDIGVGNVVGSNILNVILILGISATISPLAFSPSAFIDLAVTLAFTVMLFVFMYIGTRHELDRWQGAGFVSGYLVYLTFLILQG
jgi:cation:H+ antiporter